MPHAIPVVVPAIPAKPSDGCIQVTSVKEDHVVIDQIVDIDEDFSIWIQFTPWSSTLEFEIGIIFFQSLSSDLVDTSPGIQRTIGGHDAPFLTRLDDIIVLVLTPKILSPMPRFGAFAGVVETPVMTIDIQMTEVATHRRLPQRSLQIAIDLIPKKSGLRVSPHAPGIIGRTSQIQVVKGLCSLLPKKWILQFGFPITVSKK